MYLFRTSLLGAAMAVAQSAGADAIHCLGRAPPFMMILDGAEARFDYLGDGTFALAPAFTLPDTGLTRLTLTTYGGPLPVFVERRACPVFGTTLDFTVEIGVQTSQGMQPMVGCCREAP